MNEMRRLGPFEYDNTGLIALALVPVVLVALAVAASSGADVAALGGALLIVAAVVALYFLPAIVAFERKHHQMPAIAILNTLLGWTFLGWVAALVWAATAVRK